MAESALSSSTFSDRLFTEAVKATSDLVEPISIVQKDGDKNLNVVTLNGVDLLPDAQSQRQDLIDYFEEICNFIEGQVISSDVEDEELQQDLISEIEKKHFKISSSNECFFDMDDLEAQLLPGRGTFLVQAFRQVENLDQKKIDKLESYLNAFCSKGINCSYKSYFFPHLNVAGPGALSPLLLRLLTDGITLFSINVEHLESLFEKLYDCCCGSASSATSEPNNMGRLCLCCIWTNNAVAQFNERTNTATNPSEDSKTNHTNFLQQTTFLTVSKLFAKENKISNHVNLLQSVIKPDNTDYYYMADENPFANVDIYEKNGAYFVKLTDDDEKETLLHQSVHMSS